MSSSDEFDAYDFSEFTDKDLAAIDAHLARAHPAPAIQIAVQDSPINRFLFSRKKHLAVTDLVSPLWCEVQYEYGLYGKRHKPLQFRPTTFVSRNGKQIRVRQQIAHANDRTLKRGRSVHKALEHEVVPHTLEVRTVSEEERFGLRLLRLIDGFNQLVTDGITRELPVFTITHAQVVVGVIDEVLRSPPRQDQVGSSRPLSTPPGSPLRKRQRLVSLSTASTEPDPPSPQPFINTGCGTGSVEDTTSTCTPYELCIIDYKTRKSPNIPLDEDSLSPRLQLMMYHRMLSSVLEPETFDFDLLWSRLNLNPTKPFSAQFLKDIIWEQRQVDPTDCSVHLNRLVSEWISTFRRKCPGFTGVSQHLQIVYRRSALVRKPRDKAKRRAAEPVDVGDPLVALALQEELDLTRAIEESLGCQEVTRAADPVANTVKRARPSPVDRFWKDFVSQSDSENADPALAWAIQQSLLTCAHDVQVPENPFHNTSTSHEDETGPVVPLSEDRVQEIIDVSPIIGIKEFRMDDDELDTNIADVLQWWLGARPARGVDISQTNRCLACEYQDSCEWREQKAREAETPVSQQKV